MRGKTAHIIIALLCVTFATAQKSEGLVAKMEALFEQIPTQQFQFYTDSISNFSSETFFSKTFFPFNNYEDSLLLTQKRLLHKDYGLSFRANGRYSARNAFVLTDDQNINTQLSVNAGIQWNVLKEGFFDRKWKEDHIDVQREINSLETQQQEAEKQYGLRYQHIIYEFNRRLEVEFTNQIGLLKLQLDVYYALYYEHLVSYQDILALKKKMDAIDTQLQQITSFNEQYEYKTTASTTFGLFDIAIDDVVNYYNTHHNNEKLLSLKNEQLALQKKKKNLAKLNLFIQYQAQQSLQQQVQYTPMVGFNFSVPLQRKVNPEHLNYESEIIKEFYTITQENTIKEIHVNYKEFVFKLKQFKDLYYNFQLQKEKLLTVKFTKQYAKASTVIASLQHINEMMVIQTEAISLLSQLYLKALKIFTLAGIEVETNCTDFMKNVHISEAKPKQIYVLWNTQKPLDNAAFMLNYLKRKHYNTILLTGNIENKTYALVKEMLVLEGFTVIEQLTAYETLKIKNLESLSTIKSTLTKTEQQLVLEDIHMLIQLEKQHLKL